MRYLHPLGLVALVTFLAIPAISHAEAKPNKSSQKSSGQSKPKALLVKAVKVEKQPSKYELDYPGIVKSASRKTLSFRVGGLIEKIPVSRGQTVKEGDLIASLDAARFQNALDQAEASLAKARAAQEEVQAEYERVRKLWADGDVSKQNLQKAAAEAKSANQDLEIARKNLANAKLDLSYASLKAPVDGVIADLPPRADQVVGAGEPIAIMVDASKLRFKVNLPPKAMNTTDSFSSYECVFPSLGGVKTPAKLHSIGPSALPPLRSIPLEVDLASIPAKARIVPGTAGILRITVSQPDTKRPLLVPASAVVGDAKGASHLWIVNAKTGQAKKKSVKVKGLQDGRIAIESGITPGDEVITAGQNVLSPGCKVHVVKPEQN